jgi:excinuclease UvrABC helicase subunit UvrB
MRYRGKVGTTAERMYQLEYELRVKSLREVTQAWKAVGDQIEAFSREAPHLAMRLNALKDEIRRIDYLEAEWTEENLESVPVSEMAAADEATILRMLVVQNGLLLAYGDMIRGLLSRVAHLESGRQEATQG